MAAPMKLTLFDYMLMLDAGPLSADDRAVVKRARREYRAMERGDAWRTLRALKDLIARSFVLSNHDHEANQLSPIGQGNHDPF